MLEAFICLGWARLLKALPFSRLAPSLGGRMTETPMTHESSNEMTIRRISQAVRVMSRHTVWESQCMVKAIAAKKMLDRRRIESTLYLGTARDEQGKMIAHAWLRSGPFYVTGAEEMHLFTVVASFGTDNTQGED
ncbi:lasso peptide biosynthesis B2 protein [Paenibacillus silvisoli]|uniref:lasso peptide biosynthesis B2 protein n=1 Tax=Paenibacillus silvisoli TaxID=3110539 RepID=UPI002804BD4F|nr:lasso peptide biosynthesis B2 protein [Paenibacillus silvisoli]